MPTPTPARLAAQPADYARLGLAPDAIAAWEDGRRTDGGPGTYEWWYLRRPSRRRRQTGHRLLQQACRRRRRRPRPAGHADAGLARWPAHRETLPRRPLRAYQAATTGCDVRIGPHTFRGDLHTYQIHVAFDNVEADLTLTGTVPAWRPASGYLVFGAQAEHYFAWLPAVPQGTVSGILTLDGQSRGAHRQRLPRPQLGQPLDGAPAAPLVLGARADWRTRSSPRTSPPNDATAMRPSPSTCSPRVIASWRTTRASAIYRPRGGARPRHRQARRRRHDVRIPRRGHALCARLSPAARLSCA